MDFIKALFDLAKGVAWPLAIALVVYWFRAEIRSALPRLREAGPTGVKLDPAQEQQRQLPAKEAVSGQLRDLPGMARTPAIENTERVLHEKVQEIPADQRIDLLVRVLAETQLTAAFERLYRSIFGSQIRLLRVVNTSRWLSIPEAKQVYEHAKGRFPDQYQNYSFEQWLGFLTDNTLLRLDPDGLTLTDAGRDFLVYLTVNGLSEDKLL